MKKTLILLAATLSALAANAGNYALKVNLRQGFSATYILSDKPVITYSGNDVIIRSQGIEDSYLLSDVKSFTFTENGTSGIESVTDNVTYEFHDNVFTCEGQVITVYNLSGLKVASGSNSVSLESLDRGIYIVNTGNRAIKVMKK